MEWISVNDRLPKPWENVLVYISLADVNDNIAVAKLTESGSFFE